MDIRKMTEWLLELDKRSHAMEPLKFCLDPPGCNTLFVASPFSPENLGFTIGIVNEHRFAFYYWARFYSEYILTNKYRFECPILVTFDYHNDVGADNDFKASDLDILNINDGNELGLFCWMYLNPLNDGQILPALYLNLFSDVYVLNTKLGSERDRPFTDQNGETHHIKYFKDLETIANQLEVTGALIYLDIDLDFFTRYPDEEERMGSAQPLDNITIQSILNLKNPLMLNIHPRMIGLTIALEFRHCGGINNSLKILHILNDEIFGGSLGRDHCSWKK